VEVGATDWRVEVHRDPSAPKGRCSWGLEEEETQGATQVNDGLLQYGIKVLRKSFTWQYSWCHAAGQPLNFSGLSAAARLGGGGANSAMIATRHLPLRLPELEPRPSAWRTLPPRPPRSRQAAGVAST
jgi:hypothetical protein